MSTNKDWINAVILDDSDSEIESIINDNTSEKAESNYLPLHVPLISPNPMVNENPVVNENPMVNENPVVNENPMVNEKKKRTRSVQQPLQTYYNDNLNILELGIDEAGRGPMFGRVYAGAVVLPKDDSFNHSLMKDSKKFHSKKKIEEVAEYIKANAIAWAVEYEDEHVIDDINILQATQSAMHKAIKTILKKLSNMDTENILLLVDGNYFKPFTTINKCKNKMVTLKYQMIEGGDNKFTAIAAASILAKVERDKYIDELCLQNPELSERYGIDSNKGYGSKKHMDGIKEFGITKWHRRTFGICKNYS
jgi:ribonuclease HII